LISIKNIYYLIFLSIGLNLSFTTGFYFFDLIVLLYISVALIKKKIYLNKKTKYFIVALFTLIFFPTCLSITYQGIIYSVFENYSIYIPYNLIILTSYIIFIKNTYHKVILNETIVMSFIFMPVVIALLMFYSPSINTVITQIFNISKQNPYRPAGLWGVDSNQLGYYCVIVLIYALFNTKLKKINSLFGMIIIMTCIITNLISGMRTGLLAVIVTILLLFLFTNMNFFKLKNILVSAIFLSFFIALSFYILSLNNEEFYMFITERFEPQLFLDQLSGESDDGHVGEMYSKWLTKFSQNDSTLDILFSFDPSWKFPDSFLIFFLANNGLLGFFFLILFLLIAYILIRETKNYIIYFVFIFSLIVALKGFYPFNNIGMFLFLVLCQNNSNKEITV